MDTLTRANEGGGSGSARQYNRDPAGTTTGGQFTAGSSTPTGHQTYHGTPQPSSGGGGSASSVPAPAKFANNPEAVAQLQQLLTALGLGNLTSGTYDDATANAIKEAQKRLGIKNPNGKATQALVNKLLAAYDLSPCIKRSEDDDPDTVTRSEGDDDDV